MCFLMDDIHHYYNVAQGKITIPGVDDAEELLATDVSKFPVKIPTRKNKLMLESLSSTWTLRI